MKCQRSIIRVSSAVLWSRLTLWTHVARNAPRILSAAELYGCCMSSPEIGEGSGIFAGLNVERTEEIFPSMFGSVQLFDWFLDGNVVFFTSSVCQVSRAPAFRRDQAPSWGPRTLAFKTARAWCTEGRTGRATLLSAKRSERNTFDTLW